MAVMNIGAYIQAQISDSMVKSDGGLTQVLHKVVPYCFDVPLLGAYFPNAGNEEAVEQLRQLGMRKSPGSQIYTGNPSARNFSALLQLGATVGRYNPGSLGIDAYYAYLSMTRALCAFTCFSQVLNINAGLNFLGQDSNTQSGENAMGLDVTCVGGGTSIGVYTDGIAELSMTRWNRDTTIVTTPFSSEREHGLVPAITTISEPKLSSEKEGIVFPYFQNMVLPDKNSAWHIFKQFFSNTLSQDLETRRILMKKIRTGHRQLALFPAGMALSHAFLGISLAIEAHAEMTLIIEHSSYQGFVLQADDLKVIFDGKVIEPLEKADVLEEIADLGTHGKKLIELLAVINSISQIVGSGRTAKVIPRFSYKIEDISSSRKLVNVLRNISNEDWTAKSEQIISLTDDLKFGDKYAPQSFDSLKVFLEYMKTGDNELLREHPAWIGGGYVADRSRVAIGLGIFGVTAPSLAYGPRNGVTFSLPKDCNAPDPNVLVQSDGKRLLPYLPFQSSAIKKAVTEWNLVFSDGQLRFDRPRKGKKEFVDTSGVSLKISGDPAFSLVYQLVKEVAAETRRGRSAGGKKRTAGDADITESRAFKQAKDLASSSVSKLM
jgi:hypothetical protein